MAGITAGEIAAVLHAVEVAARAGFETLERVQVGGRVVRVAWAYDAGLESVCEFPTGDSGGPLLVADVWLSRFDGHLKTALWHGSQNVGECSLDGVPLERLVAAWERLYGVPYAGELEDDAA